VFEGVTTIAKRHPRDTSWEVQDATDRVDKAMANRFYKQRCERIAFEVEKLAEFRELESDLQPIGLGREIETMGLSSSGIVKGSRKAVVTPIVSLHEAFARLGLYHDILAGELEQAVWERLEAALREEAREEKTIFPLLGCDLPDRFAAPGLVRRLSYEDWLKLGPRGEELADLLYPYEQTSSFAGSWCLESTDKINDVLVRDTGDRYPDPSWSREEIIECNWVPLLLLALCHSGLFNVSSVVECRPGWSCKIREVSNIDRDAPWDEYESPGRDSVTWAGWADSFYGITDCTSFSRLFARMWGALQAVVKSKVWVEDELRAVAVRYLRALFSETPDLNSDHAYEDVLVQYVTCLEKLLMQPEEKQELSEKLRTRGALMAGRIESEVVGVKKFLNLVYEARSKAVHSSKPKQPRPVDLRHLRDICRRVMACKLLVGQQMANKNDLNDFLGNLTISDKYRQLARKIATEIGRRSWCWEDR